MIEKCFTLLVSVKIQILCDFRFWDIITMHDYVDDDEKHLKLPSFTFLVQKEKNISDRV